jgi:hypothetical protein
METVLLPCKHCGVPVEMAAEFASVVPVCQQCSASLVHRESAQAVSMALQARWSLLCPPRFHDTTPEQLPCPKQSESALSWTNEGNGLNLWGFPDTGKTRTMLLILRREHMAGASFRLFMAGQFEAQMERRNFKRAPWLQALQGYDLIAFDDFDKLNLTKEMERSFFALLDARMNQCKPVLLTHNSTASQLEYRFRCGEPLVRRIRDFCKSIHFPERPTTSA